MLRFSMLLILTLCFSHSFVRLPARAFQEKVTYVCPMHAEVRSATPGKCPKCAMKLVPSTPAVSGEYRMHVDVKPTRVVPGERVQLRFTIFNPQTGEQVKRFVTMHEKLFHLFIVSQDMQVFQHLHPEIGPGGSFTVETVLPRAGNYKVYADLLPEDGTPQVLQSTLTTAGYRPALFASQARLKPDTTLTKVVDGMKIELKLDPGELIAGKPVALKYHLTDAKTGAPVRDLTPYLGAWGHTLILSEDLTDFVHSHPSEVVPTDPVIRANLQSNPDVTFEALLPRPGNYRVWTQFQRSSQLTTVSFDIQVARLY